MDGLSSDLAELAKRQTTFRMQRGDAPAMRAVCETLRVTRAEIEGGAHPIRVVAWCWEPDRSEVFGRPVS